MRLNLGCGHVYKKGYINVDKNEKYSVDVVADAMNLPFDNEVFESVEVNHLIEHLGFTGCLYAFAECYRIIKSGGKLIIETPDINKSFKKFLESKDKYERARCLSWIFGEESEGLSHKILFPRDLLQDLLTKSGFNIEQEDKQTTYPYEPVLRIVCKKEDSTLHQILAFLRKSISSNGWINFDNQMEVVEFENSFIKNIELIHKISNQDNIFKAKNYIIENLITSATLTYQWLQLSKQCGVLSFLNLKHWLVVASQLKDMEFNTLLFTYFKNLADRSNDIEDGYEYILDKASLFIRQVISKKNAI